jgi:hypothetical protein
MKATTCKETYPPLEAIDLRQPYQSLGADLSEGVASIEQQGMTTPSPTMFRVPRNIAETIGSIRSPYKLAVLSFDKYAF